MNNNKIINVILSILKTGKHRLLIHPDVEGDGMDNSKTLSKNDKPTKMDKLNKVIIEFLFEIHLFKILNFS